MSIGEILKQRRVEKRRSLEEIAQRIKISVKILDALERNAWGVLPSAVYVKGYIVRYAKYLAINEKEIVALYEGELGAKGESIVVLPKIQSPSFVITPTNSILVSVGVFLGGIGLYLIFNWIHFFAPPVLTIENPAVANIVTTNNEITIQGKTEIGAELTVNGVPIYPNDNGYFEVKRFLQAGLNIIEIIATNNLGKASVETRHILYQQES